MSDANDLAQTGRVGHSGTGLEIGRQIGWYPWYVACLLCLAQLVSILDHYLMSVVLEPIKHDLQVSDSQLGLLTGPSFAIFFAIACIPLGRLADVANRRLIIVFGIFGWSIATLLCAFSNSFGTLFAARLGVGLGEAALLPSALSLIAAYFGIDKQSKGVAIFATGNSLGRAAAFIGGGAMLGLLTTRGGLHVFNTVAFKPWQGLFFLAGMLGFAVSLACLTIREPRREESARRGTLSESLSYFWRNGRLYLQFFLPFALNVATVMAMAGWMVSLYVRQFGLSIAEASALMGTSSLIIGPIGAALGGWLTDLLIRNGKLGAPPAILAAILTVCAAGALAMPFSRNLWMTASLYCVIYLALSCAGPPGYSGVQMITPERHRGLVSSFFLCTYTLVGAGLGPLVVGIFSDYLFTEDHLAYSLAATCLVFSLVGVPVALSAIRKFSYTVQEVQNGRNSEFD